MKTRKMTFNIKIEVEITDDKCYKDWDEMYKATKLLGLEKLRNELQSKNILSFDCRDFNLYDDGE